MNHSQKKRELHLSFSAKQIDNFFRPGRTLGYETYDVIDSRLVLNPFNTAIALKELFALLKTGGTLTLTYSLSGISTKKLEKDLWWLLKGHYSIISHTATQKRATLTLYKKLPLLSTKGDINEWTFGIVTNGDRDEWIKKIITSVRAQRIKRFEILICGTSTITKGENIRFIPFTKRADKGWITKKKNLIARSARYENICIVHDRVVFDKNWYRGMKQYGNMFEILSCIQKVKATKERAGDWISLNGPLTPVWNGSYPSYKHWDPYIYIGGMLTIIKKSIWNEVMWDETKYWNEFEDVDLCFRATKLGYISRINPYAQAYTLMWRHGKLPTTYNRSEGLFPKDELGTRIIRMIGRVIYKTPGINRVIPTLGREIMKTNTFKKIKGR